MAIYQSTGKFSSQFEDFPSLEEEEEASTQRNLSRAYSVSKKSVPFPDCNHHKLMFFILNGDL